MEALNPNQPRKPEEKKPAKKPWDFAMKALVIVGLILLLVIGILLPIKLVPNAVSDLAGSLSSIFRSKERVSLSVDKNQIDSGETVNLAWKGIGADTGIYSLTYQCAEGVRVYHDYTDQNGNGASDQIICETPYVFSTSTDRTLSLAINSYNQKEATVTFHLSFTKEGGSTEQPIGDANVTVINRNADGNLPPQATSTPSTPSTGTSSAPVSSGAPTIVPPKPSEPAPEPTKNPEPGPSTSAPQNPRSDLVVRLIATGIIDRSSGQFISGVAIKSTDRVAVRFQIVNRGGATASNWLYTASLPTTGANKFFTSGPQTALAPGASVTATVSFDNIKSGASTISITADAYDSVSESNEYNNSLFISAYSAGGTSGKTTGGTPTYENNGQADLRVRILATGVIRNGSFHEEDIDDGDRAAVQFEVENIGDRSSGTYDYRATIPGSNNSRDTRITKTGQSSIAAGGSRTYTVEFDADRDQDGEEFEIMVDPNNRVSESSNSNNSDSVTLDISR